MAGESTSPPGVGTKASSGKSEGVKPLVAEKKNEPTGHQPIEATSSFGYESN